MDGEKAAVRVYCMREEEIKYKAIEGIDRLCIFAFKDTLSVMLQLHSPEGLQVAKHMTEVYIVFFVKCLLIIFHHYNTHFRKLKPMSSFSVSWL